MNDALSIVIDGELMGEATRDERGRLALVYAPEWRESPDAYPLSLSMPLVVESHPHSRIEPWLWGLLPDNDAILKRWGQRFRVSPRNVFALIGAVGEDCAGAIQIVQPDRLAAVRGNAGGSV